MSQTQSFDLPDPAALDGLDQMFSPETAQPSQAANPTRELPIDLFTRGFEGVDEIVSEEIAQNDFNIETVGTFDYVQMRANAFRKGKLPSKPTPIARNIKADEFSPSNHSSGESASNPDRQELDRRDGGEIDLNGVFAADDARVSRADLANLLEGFVKVLRTDDPGEMKLSLAKVQQLASVQEELNVHEIRVEDKTQELEEMRRLVIEAQETIIKLLTDRVEDRARIATLETELRLLPDLQDQADRAMSVAFKTEEFRSELHKVKFELERYRLASARGHVPRGPRFWMSRVRRWFLKAQGLRLRDATRNVGGEDLK